MVGRQLQTRLVPSRRKDVHVGKCLSGVEEVPWKVMKELECWLSALDRPRKDTPSAEVKKCEGVKKEVKTEEAVLFQVWVLPSPPSHHQVVGASFPLTTLTTFAAIYLTSFPVARTSCANNLVANPKSSCLFCSGPTLIHLEVIPKDDTCLPGPPNTYNLQPS